MFHLENRNVYLPLIYSYYLSASLFLLILYLHFKINKFTKQIIYCRKRTDLDWSQSLGMITVMSPSEAVPSRAKFRASEPLFIKS